MVAALGLVEGAALAAVVAGANIADGLQAALFLAFEEHADGGGVFEAGHHLSEVGKGVLWPGVGIAGHQQRGFVTEGVGAHAVEVVGESGAAIVFPDALEGFADVAFVGEIAQAADMG